MKGESRSGLERLALAAVLIAALRSPAGAEQRAPAFATARFQVFDDFVTNENDALIAVGVARRFRKPELFRDGGEKACFDALAPATRAGWNAAAAWYAEIVAPAQWSGREQHLLRLDLAGLPSGRDAEDREYLGIAHGLLDAAAPAYRACRWSAQEAKNRSWIAALEGELARFEAVVAPRLEAVYRKRWSSRPILVDVVETVNWAGGNSIFPDAVGGHLLLSSGNPESAALELVFHEASHGLMMPGDPLPAALERAAAAAGVELPGELWHPVLFATTGEVVRRALEEGGRPGYVPMIEAIYGRSPWGAWRDAITRDWLPYVRGERELDEAARALLASVAPTRGQSTGADLGIRHEVRAVGSAASSCCRSRFDSWP